MLKVAKESICTLTLENTPMGQSAQAEQLSSDRSYTSLTFPSPAAYILEGSPEAPQRSGAWELLGLLKVCNITDVSLQLHWKSLN